MVFVDAQGVAWGRDCEDDRGKDPRELRGVGVCGQRGYHGDEADVGRGELGADGAGGEERLVGGDEK